MPESGGQERNMMNQKAHRSAMGKGAGWVQGQSQELKTRVQIEESIKLVRLGRVNSS